MEELGIYDYALMVFIIVAIVAAFYLSTEKKSWWLKMLSKTEDLSEKEMFNMYVASVTLGKSVVSELFGNIANIKNWLSEEDSLELQKQERDFNRAISQMYLHRELTPSIHESARQDALIAFEKLIDLRNKIRASYASPFSPYHWAA